MENEFLHESLASCSSADMVDRTTYFTVDMYFAHYFLINFPKIIHPDDITSELTFLEPIFPLYIQDFTYSNSKIEKPAERPTNLKKNDSTNKTL